MVGFDVWDGSIHVFRGKQSIRGRNQPLPRAPIERGVYAEIGDRVGGRSHIYLCWRELLHVNASAVYCFLVGLKRKRLRRDKVLPSRRLRGRFFFLGMVPC